MDHRLQEWEARGRYIDVDGRRVFAWAIGKGKPILAIHGFPCSSYDWRHIAGLMPHRRFVALDLPGFGLSDKSAGRDYSLVAQATVVERVAEEMGVHECDLIAHDMGDSVAAELLARANESRLGLKLRRVVLLNGSVFMELADPTSAQKFFLRMPPRRLRLPVPVRAFRRQVRNLFSDEHPAEAEDLEMLEILLRHEGGHRMVPVTIKYMTERRLRAERWTSGLVDWPGPLSIIWGDADPVSVPAVADRLLQLRPKTIAVRLANVGHWPQLEAPALVASELQRLLDPRKKEVTKRRAG